MMDAPRDAKEWGLMKSLAMHKLWLAQAHTAMAVERAKVAQAESDALGEKFIGSPFDAGAQVHYAKQDTAKQAIVSGKSDAGAEPYVSGQPTQVRFPKFEAAAQEAGIVPQTEG